MKSDSGLLCLAQGFLQGRFNGKASVCDRAVDAEQILIDHATCADVHVTHFAVAHLAFRKAHMLAIRAKGGMRRLRIELIHICRLGHGNGVVAIGIAEAPTVQYDECGFHAAKVALDSTPLGPNQTHRKARRLEVFHFQ